MNKLKYFLLSLIIGLASAVVIWRNHASALAIAQFDELFRGNQGSQIRSILITGQKRSIEVNDSETLSAFEKCFKDKISGTMQMGISYSIIIRFESGGKIQTHMYVHDDANGITIAHPSVTHAGDPELISFSIKKVKNQKLHSLIESLLK